MPEIKNITKNKILILIFALAIILAFLIFYHLKYKKINEEALLVGKDDIWQTTEVDHKDEAGGKNKLSSENQRIISEYFAKNISELSPEKEVLGGKFYINSLDFIDENNLIIEYEDGHIGFIARVNFQYLSPENININNFNIID